MSQTFSLKAATAAGWASSGLVGSGLAWLVAQEGIKVDPAFVLLLTGVGFIGGIAFIYMHNRYAAIIARSGPYERADYAKLRDTLAQGGLPAQIYSARLRAVLDAVDRFFGDAKMPDRTMFPHVFGLRTPAPLWTAPSFDRCLLLALAYPLATIFISWIASGHVGPAEHALLLHPNVPGWRRIGAMVVVLGTCYSTWRAVKVQGRTNWAWWIGAFVANFVAASLEKSAISLGATFIVLNTESGRLDNGLRAGVWVCTIIIALNFAFDGFSQGAIHGALTGGCGFVGTYGVSTVMDYLNERAAASRRWGWFQTAAIIVLTATCFIAAGVLGSFSGWHEFGPLLLFVGLISLLNAPFDWASIGLTRALLRRGLELGGWYPYALAVADALTAAVVITMLTVVTVLGVQTFDTLAELSGGEGARILPLDVLFNGIEHNPVAPEYWWVYAMLLSTMLPSLINLMIGGASLMRGIPWLTALLLYKMPERGGPRRYDRAWIALLLTLQVFLGALLGVAAQAALAYLVIWCLLPLLGLDLLDLARLIAAPEVPAKMLTVIFGSRLH